MQLTSQKGALFGLDARISLAIFGVLSAVAGTVIFGNISSSQVTGLQLEFKNIQNAYQNFVVDTGTDPRSFMDLISNENNHYGWNGPYVTLANDNQPTYGKYSIVAGRDQDAGSTPMPCIVGDVCSSWLKLTKMPDALAMKLDLAIDGETGKGGSSPRDGNIRVDITGGAKDNHVYYKLSRRQ